MTPRSLFNIIVKVLGIFLIKDILVTIPQLPASLSFFAREGAMPEALWTLMGVVAVLVVETMICYWLIHYRNASIWLARSED